MNAPKKAVERSGEAHRFLVGKTREIRRIAEAKGLIKKGGKNRMVTARMGDRLLAAAKQRTGITSDSELVEIAVANLAVGDDFGEWLLAQRGRLPKNFKLDGSVPGEDPGARHRHWRIAMPPSSRRASAERVLRRKAGYSTRHSSRISARCHPDRVSPCRKSGGSASFLLIVCTRAFECAQNCACRCAVNRCVSPFLPPHTAPPSSTIVWPVM
jgi:hypothetical protein